MISRREFVNGVALAGAAGALGYGRELFVAEPPPETKRITIAESRALCFAPTYVIESLLRTEGFEEITLIGTTPGRETESDFRQIYAPHLLQVVDSGRPYVTLAGSHAGCIEVFGSKSVRQLRDLKGKTVALSTRGTGPRLLTSALLAYVGINPQREVEWRNEPRLDEVARLLEQEKIQAFVGIPPEPQYLRARNAGHVILNTTTDRPWSQWFCCVFAGNREFVRKHPVATKRVLRAYLKAVDMCGGEPERVTQVIAALRPEVRSEDVRQVLKELPYGSWRDVSAEGSMRFYALRLSEAGMIKTNVQKLLAQGTDWRFLNELKKELKA